MQCDYSFKHGRHYSYLTDAQHLEGIKKRNKIVQCGYLRKSLSIIVHNHSFTLFLSCYSSEIVQPHLKWGIKPFSNLGRQPKAALSLSEVSADLCFYLKALQTFMYNMGFMWVLRMINAAFYSHTGRLCHSGFTSSAIWQQLNSCTNVTFVDWFDPRIYQEMKQMRGRKIHRGRVCGQGS